MTAILADAGVAVIVSLGLSPSRVPSVRDGGTMPALGSADAADVGAVNGEGGVPPPVVAEAVER